MIANKKNLICEAELKKEHRYVYDKIRIVLGIKPDRNSIISPITNKQLVLKAITIMMAFIIAFVSVGCGASSAEQQINNFKLYLDIISDKNALFNKCAINILIDGEEIGSVDNGEEFTYMAEVVRGEHKIEFCKEGKSKPNTEKTISVTEDTLYSCSLKHDGFAIKINNETIDKYVSGTDSGTVSTESSSESVFESAETEGAITINSDVSEIVETEGIISTGSYTAESIETEKSPTETTI